jgi:hypothetical protein
MSFTYTKIVGSWADLVVVTHTEGFEDDRPVALCKGDDTAKATEQLQQQNAQQQMAFNQQLMTLFQQQFGKQNAVMDYLNGKMKPIVDAGGKGFSDDALAAMRTSATDKLSGAYANAQRTLQTREFANGSRDLPSGVNAQLDAALLDSESADKAGAQNNITLANENQKQANYWNAVNVLNGQAAQLDPLGYAGAATNAANSATGAGNSVANLSNAVTASNQSQLMGVLGGVAGGVFGAAGQAGGFGKLFGV